MLSLSIRYFFILVCTFYSYYKICNIDKTLKIHFFINTVFCLFSSFIILLLYDNSSLIRLLLISVCSFIFIAFTSPKPIHISLTVLIIAFAISFISLAISSAIVCFFIIFLSNNNFISIYSIIAIGLLQSILIYLLFKIKRLQNGMPFLLHNSILNIGLIPALIVLSLFYAIQLYLPQTRPLRLLLLLSIFLLAIALLIWWRHKITQSYVEKLRVDEVELLYKEISDKDLEIEKLHAHNEQLSGIIHKDNKLIPAMEMAVRNYLQTAALMKPEDARQTGAELLSKLEHMAEERTGIIHTYQENFSYRQRSGLISIDAIVDYMENRASTLGIEYHYQFDKTLKEMLPAFITEDDAMHLLSDLIENAIIAVTHSEKKNIHIHIGFIRSILFIDISDSGIPFTPETYEKFGNIQYTTHAEHGGSGIGLMDIAKLKRQYQFSLQIYEYPENETIYTKKIRILFDRKAHYLIQSYRAKELRSAILRNDLHVIPYSDKEKP